MASQERIQEVKTKISVPAYFYNVIIPNMSDYYNDYVVDFDLKPTCKCCLHDEDTPSFRYYAETNTWSCFGCKKGGDVINLHRLFSEKMTGRKPTFHEAVETLYNYFIAGKESTKVVTTTKLTKDEELSTNVDLGRFSKYIERLEGQLMIDPSIPYSKKKIIWGAIDEVHILVEKNKINAVDAMNFVKNKVFEVTMQA